MPTPMRDADADADADADTDTDTTTTTTPTDGWTRSAHPCFGNRTDTMWWDEPDTVWVGCGSTTTGYGLFVSDDRGLTWSAPTTTPNGWFDTMRVDSISRSDDGLLYVAGIQTTGDERVVSLDTTTSPMVVGEVLSAMSQTWNNMQVGTFRRNSAGLAVAESLNGYDVAVRDGDAGTWFDGYGWWGGGASFQILDLAVHDDQFYGCGSTIAVPPQVFLPPPGGQAPGSFQMVPVQLVSGLAEFDGEMWGIAVDDAGVVVGGVDQDRDVGHIFVSGSDPYDAATWHDVDVSTLIPSDPTWIRGVCRDGAEIVAVGEYTQRADGLVLHSSDGGQTFTEITPSGAGPLHKCQLLADGALAVTGADGFFGIYEAP
ncbi:MAG: hypothetical protein R3F59_15170 [Myxococcota bacterium]